MGPDGCLVLHGRFKIVKASGLASRRVSRCDLVWRVAVEMGRSSVRPPGRCPAQLGSGPTAPSAAASAGSNSASALGGGRPGVRGGVTGIGWESSDETQLSPGWPAAWCQSCNVWGGFIRRGRVVTP
jgi:hypothetical protein